MLTIIVIFNLAIAGFCWYLVWRILQLRRTLTGAADALLLAERSTHRALQAAPEYWLQGKINTHRLHHQYDLVLLRLQQVRQVLTLLGLGRLFWKQYAGKSKAATRTPRLLGFRRKRSDRNKI